VAPSEAYCTFADLVDANPSGIIGPKRPPTDEVFLVAVGEDNFFDESVFFGAGNGSQMPGHAAARQGGGDGHSVRPGARHVDEGVPVPLRAHRRTLTRERIKRVDADPGRQQQGSDQRETGAVRNHPSRNAWVKRSKKGEHERQCHDGARSHYDRAALAMQFWACRKDGEAAITTYLGRGKQEVIKSEARARTDKRSVIPEDLGAFPIGGDRRRGKVSSSGRKEKTGMTVI
jgi:hypothetical protein